MMSRVRRPKLTGLALLCTTVAALTAQSAPASANIGHTYLSQITEVPAGPGVTASGPFGTLEGGMTSVAGNLFVFDPSKGVLDEFNSSNGLVTQLDGLENGSNLEGGSTLAVSRATGETYSTLGDGVAVYSPTGELLNTLRGENLTTPTQTQFEFNSVAIDNATSGPAAGDVYISGEIYWDGVPRWVIDVFKPGVGGKLTFLKEMLSPAAEEVSNMAIDEETGDLLVVPYSERAIRKRFVIYKPTVSGEDERLATVTGPPGDSFEKITGITADPSNGDIYVADGPGGVVYQFNSSGEYLGQIANTASGPITPYEVAVNSTGDVYVGDLATDAVDVFGSNITVPAATTEAVSGVTGRSATLGGTVNPSGFTITKCQFEYGTSGAYGSTAPCSSPPAGGSPVAVTTHLSGLAPGTAYHYRLAVTDSEGTLILGRDATFATRNPEASVAAPTHELSTSATINASVDPNEVAVETCQFEYGLGESYSATAPCSPAPGAGPAPVAVSANLTGLALDAVYHYRVVLTFNDGETSASPGGGEVLATTPLVDGTAPVTNVTSFAATLTGMFLAAELAPTYHFAYGLTSAYGSVAPLPDAKGSANVQQAVSQTLTGLQPGTTYHYALVTTNFGGGEAIGPDETFTTRPLVPPGIVTGGVQEVTATSAALTGAVNAEGLPTTYRFEYGTSTAYGSTWPTVQVYAGTGSTSEGIAVTVPNLQPASTYHYRLVADNEDGTTYGSDQTFTTPGYPISMVQETPVLTAALGYFNPEVGHSAGKPKKPKSAPKKRKAKKAKKKKKHGK